jgi:hypothetical protein
MSDRPHKERSIRYSSRVSSGSFLQSRSNSDQHLQVVLIKHRGEERDARHHWALEPPDPSTPQFLAREVCAGDSGWVLSSAARQRPHKVMGSNAEGFRQQVDNLESDWSIALLEAYHLSSVNTQLTSEVVLGPLLLVAQANHGL